MTTPKLLIPELLALQSAPEVTINDAFRRIDALMSMGVLTMQTDAAPPTGPLDGDMHVVGAAASGEWTGHEGEIAYFSVATWKFVVPQDGVLVWSIPGAILYVYQTTTSPAGWTALFAL